MKKIYLTLIISLLAVGCTDKDLSKSYGGTTTIKLPVNKKLITATWKEGNNIWYLVRERKSGEQPETHEFIESSNLGIFEGKVIFQETFDK